MYEVLDRLTDIPVIIPPSYMIRIHGKPLKDKPWLVAKIDKADRADMWKFLHKEYFK